MVGVFFHHASTSDQPAFSDTDNKYHKANFGQQNVAPAAFLYLFLNEQ
jgi:hypothetical protein